MSKPHHEVLFTKTLHKLNIWPKAGANFQDDTREDFKSLLPETDARFCLTVPDYSKEEDGPSGLETAAVTFHFFVKCLSYFQRTGSSSCWKAAGVALKVSNHSALW